MDTLVRRDSSRSRKSTGSPSARWDRPLAGDCGRLAVSERHRRPNHPETGRVSILVALAAGMIVVFFLAKSRLNYLRLPVLRESAGRVQENVTVVIPARDEEKNISRAVGSFPGARVLVVDDDSSDHTAELARRAGAEVIPAPPIKAGVFGKPNACLAGARATDSKWLLFVDADTWYEPGFLTSLLRYASEEQLDAASVFLKQECVSWPERILLPYAFALYFCGVNARRVNRVASPEAL